MQDKLNALIEKQCASIPRSVEAIGTQLRSVPNSGAYPASGIDQARALVHQLKGISGTAGFSEICDAATALYDCLDGFAENVPPSGGEMDRALALCQQLTNLSRDLTPRSSWLYAPASASGSD